MIEFKAFLGPDGGLHFACTRLESETVHDEWMELQSRAKELMGTGLGLPMKVICGEDEPNPAAILALIVDGALRAAVDAEWTPLYVQDHSQPDGRRFVRNQLVQSTIVAWLPEDPEETDVQAEEDEDPDREATGVGTGEDR